MMAAEMAPPPLHDTTGDDAPDRVGIGGNGGTKGEHQQSTNDDGASTDAIGQRPQGNLQDRLGQTIGTYGQANQCRGGIRQLLTIGRQDREHHEHTEHTKGEDQSQPQGGTAFDAVHGFTALVEH
ncbi:hypothetical protein QE393_004356 [Pseudomonas sp. SORGH_AS 211]|nr:hypothetical protein [Pseudomonas sp. SORGH_AS_0211]